VAERVKRDLKIRISELSAGRACLHARRAANNNYITIKVVNAMVELDQMKQELQTYESPLAEVRDSL